MLPLLLAPLASRVVGNLFHLNNAAASAPYPGYGGSFASVFNQMSGYSAASAPTGTLQAQTWMQWSPGQTQNFMQSLMGRQVTATETTGQTVAGVVNGFQNTGNSFALSIGGQLVPLNQMSQVSWSPATT